MYSGRMKDESSVKTSRWAKFARDHNTVVRKCVR